MTSLTLDNLHKGYQNTPVLKGISLTVPEGTFTAVLGASGSGKTTLLRMIAGFERADRGQVRLGDQVVEGPGMFVPPEQRGVGYVSQDGSLFPHLSVADNVGFGLRRPERRSGRVEALLDLVGLRGLGRRYPHQLSGGEQQRVSLARALAPRPRLILMDEPFSALDASLRTSLRVDVRTVLREAGVTAILVTHDQDEALSLADQVVVLRNGILVQSGQPKEIYEGPVDPDLAHFLGSSNVLEGVIHGGQAETVLGLLPVMTGGAPWAEGSLVTVLVRPEQLRIAPGETPTGTLGRVDQCDYFGHDALVTVQTLAGPTPGTWTARVHGHEAPAPGTSVRLRFEGKALAWSRSLVPHQNGEHRDEQE